MKESIIQDKIFLFLQRKNQVKTNYDCISTNLKVYNWESDMLFIDRKSHVYEMEIKTTTSDLKADFKKIKKHNAIRLKAGKIPNYLYFVIPERSIGKVDIPNHYGIIIYTERLKFSTHREASMLHNGKIELKDKIKLIKSNYYKYWNERLKNEGQKIFNIR